MFSKALRFTDPILLGGIMFSVGIGLLMYIGGNDTLPSLTITLLSTLVTLGVDIVTRQAKTEKTLIEAMEMSQMFADDSIRDSLKEIAANHQIVKSYDYDVFSNEAEASIQECLIRTSELASGTLRFEGNQVQELGSTEYERATKHIKVMHKNDMDYWTSPFILRHTLRDILLVILRETSSPHKASFPPAIGEVDHNCRSFPKPSASYLN